MRAIIAVLALVPAAACATLDPDKSLVQPAPAAAGPQVPAAPSPAPLPERGAHVRVVFPATGDQPQRFQYGNFYRLAPDTVFLAHGISADTVLLGGGRTLERVIRSRHQGRNGALLGVMGGAITGAMVAAAAWEPCEATGGMFDMSCMFAPSQGAYAAGGALLGGLLGGVVGYAVGAAIRTEEWGTVPLAGARVSLAEQGIGLRVAF